MEPLGQQKVEELYGHHDQDERGQLDRMPMTHFIRQFLWPSDRFKQLFE
jgi:hypothetical protein